MIKFLPPLLCCALGLVSTASADKADWLREVRFGMFINWGVYAVPAAEWKGKRVTGGSGEWIMKNGRIPIAYEVLPGNTTDKTTLADFLKKIETQYGKADRIWIMDRGIPTEDTLRQMRQCDPPVSNPKNGTATGSTYQRGSF